MTGTENLQAEVGGQDALYVAGLEALQSGIGAVEDEALRNELYALCENLTVGGTDGLQGNVMGIDQLGVSSGPVTGTENVISALDAAEGKLTEAQEAVDGIGGVGSEVLEQAAAAMGSAAESARLAAGTIAEIRDSEIIQGFLEKIGDDRKAWTGKSPRTSTRARRCRNSWTREPP